MLVNTRENLEINRSTSRFKQTELTEVGITIAKLKTVNRKKSNA